MPPISATPDVLDYQTKRWLEGEYRRTLVHHRNMVCSPNEALRIEVPKFLCPSCFGAKVDGVFLMPRGPDVLSPNRITPREFFSSRVRFIEQVPRVLEPTLSFWLACSPGIKNHRERSDCRSIVGPFRV